MEPPEEITVDLMEKMIREVEKDASIRVLPSLEVRELQELHGGSSLKRVTLQFTRPGDQAPCRLSLVVKTQPEDPAVAEAFRQGTMFLREVHMFQEVLPRMTSLLARAMPGRHEDYHARVYHTRTTPNYFIAVEDLAPKGFKAPDRSRGLDLEDSKLVLRTLARFHAASVMVHLQDEDLFRVFDVYCYKEGPLNKAARDISGQLLAMVAHAIDSWEGFGPGWGDRLRQRFDTLFDDLDAAWTRDDAAFNVLNHGDFALHNVMFRRSEDVDGADSVMLVDFQCCSYISPACDLVHFIFSSVSDAVRTDHVDELLEEYHEELTVTLEMLGAPEDQTISLPQLVKEFESKMEYAFLCSISYLPFFGLDLTSGITPGDIFKICREDSSKIETFLSDSCVKSLKRLIPFFCQKKIL